MTIYLICRTEDVGTISDRYVTRVEDIEQLAIDEYWGTPEEPEPTCLDVVVDMVLNTVLITDMGTISCVEYTILEFEQKGIK